MHEAMDQSGAVAGPLLVSVILYLQYGYTSAFAVLLVPALISPSARFQFRRPRDGHGPSPVDVATS